MKLLKIQYLDMKHMLIADQNVVEIVGQIMLFKWRNSSGFTTKNRTHESSD